MHKGTHTSWTYDAGWTDGCKKKEKEKEKMIQGTWWRHGLHVGSVAFSTVLHLFIETWHFVQHCLTEAALVYWCLGRIGTAIVLGSSSCWNHHHVGNIGIMLLKCFRGCHWLIVITALYSAHRIEVLQSWNPWTLANSKDRHLTQIEGSSVVYKARLFFF